MHGEPEETGGVRNAEMPMEDGFIARSVSRGSGQLGVSGARARDNVQTDNAMMTEGADVESEDLNNKALKVLDRVQKKLSGRDFGRDQFDVPIQVRYNCARYIVLRSHTS